MHQRLLIVFLSFSLLASSAFGITTHKKHRRIVRATTSTAKAVQRVAYTTSRQITGLPRKHKVASPWTSPTFADSTIGDSVDGEDLLVRRAAVAALGPYNGSVVVADPSTGRLLTVVNQKLAFQGAYEPCSTIKIMASLAGLSEGIITQETALKLSKRHSIDLTSQRSRSWSYRSSGRGSRDNY